MGDSTVSTADQSISQEGRALLDTIAGTESPGYNTEYGGTKFSSYDDHPRDRHAIMSGPNAGRTSDAAGRYQFLSSTWDPIAKKLGLKDFSPESQDKGAWYLARTTYQQKTGRDLGEDLKSKDPNVLAMVGQSLSGQWTSLPGGIEAGTSGNSFASRYGNNFKRETPAPAIAAAPAPGAPVASDYMSKGAIMNDADLARYNRDRAAHLAKTGSIVLGGGSAMASPYGTLRRPMGDTPGLHSSIDSSKTIGDINHTQNFTINGPSVPQNLEAARLSASRGQQDLIRNMQAAVQ